MPKRREREEENLAKKKFRQTKLDFHFIGREKKQPEAEGNSVTGEEEAVEMSAEERAETQRRRELMAAAAERRKQSESPWTTPPHSPENLQQEQASAASRSTPNKSNASSSSSPSAHAPGRTTSTKDSDMGSAFSKALDDLECDRTRTGDVVSSDRTASRTELYDQMLERAKEEFEKDWERPSTSKPSLSRSVSESEGKFEREGEDFEGIPGSPTLEYNMYDGDGSAPLFTDSEPLEESSESDNSPSYWKGVPILQLNRAPDCRNTLPEMRPANDHTILFRIRTLVHSGPHVRSDIPPLPFPETYQDRWDSDHVRMPCSPENLYPVEDQAGTKKVQSRWELIESTLLSGIKSSIDLEEAILTYNARYSQRWNFRALHTLFTEVLSADETVYFFDKVLPGMISLALQLPKLCTKAIPLLRRQHTHSITLSQQQIASLLANAFFCTFPRRNAQQKKSEYSKFPDINFNRLFEMGKGVKNHRKIEKLKCIVNYFSRVTAKVPTGTVTISRRAIKDMPRWERSNATLNRLHMAASGMIEREGHGMLQMDFANKFIGGGVLGFGSVQEEIRFMICPELIVTRLVTEVIEDNECIIIKGAEQFSEYSGYADSFKWKSSFQDSTPSDAWGRRETEIAAIDALVIRRYDDQFRPDLLRRELNKAYCGFYGNSTAPKHLPAIASGNWGCGAFGGDPRLKGLLQLMAASEAGRDLVLFTFGDRELCDDLASVHEFLTSQAITVSDLWSKLLRYRRDVLQRPQGASKPKLLPFLYEVYTTCDSDTDEYEVDGGNGEEARTGSLSPNYKAGTP